MDSIINEARKEPSVVAKRKIAEKAIPVRVHLAEKWTEMTQILLSKITTTGEMGTLANLEMHNLGKRNYLFGYDRFLQSLGLTLPYNCFPTKLYSGKTRVIVTSNESILEKNNDFYLRVRVLAATKTISGKLFWRFLGKGNFQAVELKKMDRNVFEETIPKSEISTDFEYYLEVFTGSELVKFPITSPEINRTVVVME